MTVPAPNPGPPPPRNFGTASRGEAERRARQIRAFRAELQSMRADGVAPLTPEQRAEIERYHEGLLAELASRFEIDRSERAGQLSRGMQLASFFAAVALTLAVYSLVARYWGRLDLPLQATLLTFFPLASLVCVELSARRERTLYIASLFAIVAYGTFWLVAGELSRLLNIPFTTYVVWAGALFGLALALPFGFRLILAVALGAAIAAVAGTVFQATGVPWTEMLDHPEPVMIAAFLSTILAPRLGEVSRDFAPVVRLVGVGLGLLSVFMLSLSGGTSLLPLADATTEPLYQVMMVVLTIVLLAISIRHHWPETTYLVAALFTLFLLTRFVDWFWDALPRFVFFLLLAGVALGWLVVLRRLRLRMGDA